MQSHITLPRGVWTTSARWPIASGGRVATCTRLGSSSSNVLRRPSAVSSARVVHCWPCQPTYCRSSSQIGQRSGGESPGAYCTPHVRQMKATSATRRARAPRRRGSAHYRSDRRSAAVRRTARCPAPMGGRRVCLQGWPPPRHTSNSAARGAPLAVGRTAEARVKTARMPRQASLSKRSHALKTSVMANCHGVNNRAPHLEERMKRLFVGLLVLVVLVSIGSGLAGRLNELLPLDVPTSIASPRTVGAPAHYVDAA